MSVGLAYSDTSPILSEEDSDKLIDQCSVSTAASREIYEFSEPDDSGRSAAKERSFQSTKIPVKWQFVREEQPLRDNEARTSFMDNFRKDLRIHRYLLLFFLGLQLVVAITFPWLHSSALEAESLQPDFRTLSTRHELLSFFESHADSHPHIHLSLAEWMRSSCMWSILHLVFVLHIHTFSKGSKSKRSCSTSRIYGAYNLLCIVVHLSAMVFGGLESKGVLFPDSWMYATSRWTHQWASHLPGLQIWPSLVGGSTSLMDPSNSGLFSMPKTFLTDSFSSRHTPVNFAITLKLIFAHLSERVSMRMLLMSGLPSGILLLFIVHLLIHFTIVFTGICIDLLGVYHQIRSCYRYLVPADVTILAVLLGTMVSIGKLYLTDPGCNGSDGHWMAKPATNTTLLCEKAIPYHPDRPPVFASTYLPMKDGTKLALDVFFPRTYVEDILDHRSNGRGLPTFLDVTRYNRRITVRWPFSMLSLWGQERGSSVNIYNYNLVHSLSSNGYVVVVADTRGSGSSFGHRPVDFSEEEAEDFKTLVQWIKGQFWSSGKVATGGVSYDGMTGLHAAARGGIDATLALFTPIDVVSDMLQPGGIVCSSFLQDYTRLTLAFEKSGTPLPHLLRSLQYPWQIIAGFTMAFGITAPVKGREGDLNIAIDQHKDNWNMERVVDSVRFKDDTFYLTDGRLTEVSHAGITPQLLDRLANNNVSVYAVGGYCDSTGVRGAARLHNYLKAKTPNVPQLLTIGPWTHTGKRNCSPYSTGTYACFDKDLYADVVRFLDCVVKGDCWGGIKEEFVNKNVHYFQVGEETWYHGNSFPPKDVVYRKMNFSSQQAFDEQHMSFVRRYRSDNKHAESFTHGNHVSHADWSTTANDISDTFGSWLAAWQSKAPIRKREKRVMDRFFKRLRRLRDATDGLVGDVLANSFKMIDESSDHERVAYEEDTIRHVVSYTTTTGIRSRWVVAQHPFRLNVEYSSKLRNDQAKESLVFTSLPLSKDQRIVGSPWLAFYIRPDILRGVRANRTDISVFAYLEDIEYVASTDSSSRPPKGVVHYMTEGHVLLSHRPSVSRPCDAGSTGLSLASANTERCDPSIMPGSPDVVVQPGTREWLKYTSDEEPELITMTFEPIAWTVRRGHSIRLSLTGADIDNFLWDVTAHKSDYGPGQVLPDVWNVMLGGATPGWLAIPEVPA